MSRAMACSKFQSYPRSSERLLRLGLQSRNLWRFILPCKGLGCAYGVLTGEVATKRRGGAAGRTHVDGTKVA